MSSFNGTATCVSLLAPSWPGCAEAHLLETNVLGLLTEALTAEVELVLADQTSLVLADTAKKSSLAQVPFYTIQPIAIPSSRSTGGGMREIVPAAGALAVGARAGVPDRLVRHIDGCCRVSG